MFISRSSCLFNENTIINTVNTGFSALRSSVISIIIDFLNDNSSVLTLRILCKRLNNIVLNIFDKKYTHQYLIQFVSDLLIYQQKKYSKYDNEVLKILKDYKNLKDYKIFYFFKKEITPRILLKSENLIYTNEETLKCLESSDEVVSSEFIITKSKKLSDLKEISFVAFLGKIF
jgi:hypothetical protein